MLTKRKRLNIGVTVSLAAMLAVAGFTGELEAARGQGRQYSMPFATISSGAVQFENGGFAIVGQAFVGTISNEQYIMQVGALSALFGGGTTDFVSPELPSDAKHQARKHRYLSINPSTNPGKHTLIKVEIAEMQRCQNDPRRGCLVDDDCRDVCENDLNKLCTSPTVCGGANCIDSGPCVDATPMWNRFSTAQAPVAWLVQEPMQIQSGCLAFGCDPATENCCGDEDWVARLSDTVYSQDWSARTLIHISDCGIVPGITYNVYACDPANISVCSEPLIVGTQQTPSGTHLHFGDIAGPPPNAGDPYKPPDGFVNVVDVSAWGLTKQNYGTPTPPQLHPTMADLHGSGYGVPANYILGLSDQQAIINHGFTWALPWDNPDMLGGVDPSTCPGRLP